ncbi:hypothetical protein LUZ60_000718 [Juncus effusus]|nr:hypothetical protein LUZ60_000718 [Juncus effusus]
MALSINCCLKPSPSPNPSSSTRSAPTPPCLSTFKDQNEWRRRFIATVACVVISSTTSTIVKQDSATAGEMIRPMEISSAKMVRWSDIRTCPPWRDNSLESIVPENLPRPFSSRRPNNVVTHGSETAQIGRNGGASIWFDKRCFSL